jgi:Flp pilus assembly protein TadG
MSISKRIARKFLSLSKSERGNVGIMCALTALPMLLAAGAAIDFGRFTSAQTQVQAALDAATLAAAAAPQGTSLAKRQEIGNASFFENMKGGAAGDVALTPSFELKSGIIKASVSGEMKTSFMKLGGIDSMALNVGSEVNVLSNKKAEIVMVLDYSGSMGESVKGGVKYELMRAAATKLVSDLERLDQDSVKIGLVPFSQYVHATLPKQHVMDTEGAGSWSGCTQDRAAPYNTSNDEPDGSAGSKWGQPLNKDHESYTCDGFVDNKLKIVPLTDDFDRVTGTLSGMKPYGYTHLALGFEFGLHVVSPSSPYTEGVSFEDEDTIKYIVMLTDGSQTERAKGPGGVNTVEQGEKNLEQLCGTAKGLGIKVITMAFDLTDKDPSKAEETKARLRNCATDPASDYFDANDGKDLDRAFESIRTQVAQNIFLNK